MPYCVASEPAHLEEPPGNFRSVVADRKGTVEGVGALWDIDERDPESTRRKRSILQMAPINGKNRLPIQSVNETSNL